MPAAILAVELIERKRMIEAVKTNLSGASGESQHLGALFSDTIVLDNQYNLISVSPSILEATKFSSEELIGRSISFLSHTYNLLEFFDRKLCKPHFEEELVEVRTKDHRVINYQVSGCRFKEGNGFVFLKFINIDEVNFNYEQALIKTAELDQFVYLSAHALRGPLATLKGLVNIARICDDKAELAYLLSEINAFAEKLDDKLHRLIYFAESDKAHELPVTALSIEQMLNQLQPQIQEASIDFPVKIQSLVNDPTVTLAEGELILTLLRNLAVFFCQQPKALENSMVFDVHCSPSSIELIMRAKGFYPAEALKEKLRIVNFGYSEILHQPELLNCYAAKKIVFKLKGSIQFIMTQNNETVVLITLPL